MNFSESASAVPLAGRGLVLEENVYMVLLYLALEATTSLRHLIICFKHLGV